MLVNEIFKSIQGEGLFIGEISLFIRFFGCNLNCKWCDTKISNYKVYYEYEIKDFIKESDIKNIVFTGGEPFLYIDHIINIMNDLNNKYKFIIETNGTIFNDFSHLKNKDNLFLSISPKFNSAIKNRKILDKTINNINKLYEIFNDNIYLKFVIDTENDKDFEDLKYLLIKIPDLKYIFVQPVYINNFEEYMNTYKKLINKIDKINNNIRILIQLHKIAKIK